MLIGYARVSTQDQQLDAQIEQLKSAGCETIYQEKVSGNNTKDRPQLAKLMKAINGSDTLIVSRIDRLARSTLDLLTTLNTIRERGAEFKSLAEDWANTTTAEGRMILTFIGGIAEFERELIKSRTSAGRVRAKARGVKFGRKFKLTPHQRQEALGRMALGVESLNDIGKSYNVSHTTIMRLR